MSLSRRKFTNEFKMAAVRRLETGPPSLRFRVPVRSRPICWLGGGGSFGRTWIAPFRGWGERRPRRAKSPNWSAKSASRPWKSIFLKRALQRVGEAWMLQALNRTTPSINKSSKKSNGKRP